MKDLRTNNIMVKGHNLTAGYKINKDTVLEMLTFLGVPNAENMVDEAISYLSSNSMEFNMSNLDGFLKSKKILSNCKDLRKLKKK